MLKKYKTPRPPNAFILYRIEIQNIIKTTNHKFTNAEVSKKAGKMWHNLSKEEKEKFKKKAEVIKYKHLKLYPNYKYKPRRPEEIKKRNKYNFKPNNNNEKITSLNYKNNNDFILSDNDSLINKNEINNLLIDSWQENLKEYILSNKTFSIDNIHQLINNSENSNQFNNNEKITSLNYKNNNDFILSNNNSSLININENEINNSWINYYQDKTFSVDNNSEISNQFNNEKITSLNCKNNNDFILSDDNSLININENEINNLWINSHQNKTFSVDNNSEISNNEINNLWINYFQENFKKHTLSNKTFSIDQLNSEISNQFNNNEKITPLNYKNNFILSDNIYSSINNIQIINENI